MLEFARALGKLDKSALERMAAANLREDVETVESLAKELEFERFCVQFCHWVCFLRCQRFCICVCPPRSIAVFTKIGGLFYGIRRQQSRAGERAHDRRQPGLLQRASPERRDLGRQRSAADRVPLRDRPGLGRRDDARRRRADPADLVGAGHSSARSRRRTSGSSSARSPFPPFVEVIEVWVKKTGARDLHDHPELGRLDRGTADVPDAADGAVVRLAVRARGGSDPASTRPRSPPTVVDIDETGVTAGTSANAPLQTDAHYGVRMRIRNQGTSGEGTEAGTCSHIAINNSYYNNISHHPYWPGGLFGASNELAVASIGIAELAAAPCSELTLEPHRRVHGRPLEPRAGRGHAPGPRRPLCVRSRPGCSRESGRELVRNGNTGARRVAAGAVMELRLTAAVRVPARDLGHGAAHDRRHRAALRLGLHRVLQGHERLIKRGNPPRGDTCPRAAATPGGRQAWRAADVPRHSNAPRRHDRLRTRRSRALRRRSGRRSRSARRARGGRRARATRDRRGLSARVARAAVRHPRE